MPLDETAFKAKMIRNARKKFSRPQLSQEWLSQTLENVIDAAGFPYFDYAYCDGALADAILNAPFEEIALRETSGLSTHVHPQASGTLLVGPIVLEIVHIMESVQTHLKRFTKRVTQNDPTLRIPRPHYATLPQYPRNRLKVVLSDGFLELEAVECQRLPNVELGKTPTGTKVRLTNFPVLLGVAQISPQNFVVLGGEVPGRELEHSVRLFRDIEMRLEEEVEAMLPKGRGKEFGTLLMLSTHQTPTPSSMSSSYQRGWTKLEISFSQLLTMLNMVSDEHIDETTALSMLTGLGVATPLSLVPPPPQTPSVNEDGGSSRAAGPLPIPNPSSAFADQGEPSNSKTPVGQIPTDIRWYAVTCGERIGAVQGWNRAESLVCNVSGGRQTPAKGKEDARKRFFDAVLDPMVKVRSVTGEVVGIPGITAITSLVSWAEAEAGRPITEFGLSPGRLGAPAPPPLCKVVVRIHVDSIEGETTMKKFARKGHWTRQVEVTEIHVLKGEEYGHREGKRDMEDV
ncbi:hypothetical protein FA13DRAFT_1716728 [Coprinellus micaceus]|uniref:RecQ-mediated genome instability protein 1 n=1 Tax=Coprinellus micaceus TaxID=71717 RepID=A0A4Y7SI93_COPMI|nr:hypothetical protein FA13DRAFT_1716728 [Coprinellus micaceus]